MYLTPAQLTTLSAAIVADGAFAAARAAHDTNAITDLLNGPSMHVVWKTSLTPEESRRAIVQGATQLDALTAGKRDSLFWLVSETLTPSDAPTRQALDDLCGSQNLLKAALQVAQKRSATVLEKIFATGTGTTASPATLVVEGQIDEFTIRRIAWSDSGTWLL